MKKKRQKFEIPFVQLQIVLKGPLSITIDCLKCFSKLLPDSMHHLICIDSEQYVSSTKCRLLSVLPQVTLPPPSEKMFFIEFLDDTNTVHIKWLGTCPNKCKFCNNHSSNFPIFLNFSLFDNLFIAVPSLLTKILKAVDEKLLTDLVLLKQIRALVEEWKK